MSIILSRPSSVSIPLPTEATSLNMTCHSGRNFVPPYIINPKSSATTQITKDESGSQERSGARPSASTQQSWLLEVPAEILAHIFSFLDSPCPSEVNFHNLPNKLLTRSGNLHLKSISFVCKRFRSTVLPLLFCHVRLDPYKLTDFLSFVKANGLTTYIKSAVAGLQGPCNHLHPVSEILTPFSSMPQWRVC